MGLRGLTTYTNRRNKKFFKDYELHDCNLVIDGGCLCKLYNMRDLYFKSGYTHFSPNCYGGDYDKFAQTLRFFFKLLKECNITAYIILDGGRESNKSSLKKESLERRAKNASKLTPDTIRGIYGNDLRRTFFYSEGKGLIYPLALKYTLRDLIRELELNVYVSIFESDIEVASLAKQLDCPVLACDSDYFVFGSTYIPLTSLNLNVKLSTNWRNEYKYIPCQIFNMDVMEKYFQDSDTKMTKHYLLPVLIGNDSIKQTLLSTFIQSTISGNEQERIEGIFKWVSQQSTLETAIKEILNTFDTQEERCIIFKQIKDVILSYMPISVVPILEHFNIEPKYAQEVSPINFQMLAESFGIKEETTEKVNDDVPELFLKKFRSFKYLGKFMNIFKYDSYFVQPDLEDCFKPDANSIGYKIMSAIHKILVHSEEKRLTVLRRNSNIELEEFVLPKCTFSLPSMEDIESLCLTERLDNLLQILEIDAGYYHTLKVFPNEWHLFLLSLKYYLSETRFQISLSFVYALVLCFIILNYVDLKLKEFCRTTCDLRKFENKFFNRNIVTENNTENVFSRISEKDCYIFIEKIINNFQMNPEDTAETFDRSIIHSLAEFKCVFLHVNDLNTLLKSPVRELGLSQMFDGTFIYNITKYHKNKSDLKGYFYNFLYNCPTIKDALFYVVDFLLKQRFTF